MQRMLIMAAFVSGLFSSEPKDLEPDLENARNRKAQQEIQHYSIAAREQEILRLTIELNKTNDNAKKEECRKGIKGHLDYLVKTYGGS